MKRDETETCTMETRSLHLGDVERIFAGVIFYENLNMLKLNELFLVLYENIKSHTVCGK